MGKNLENKGNSAVNITNTNKVNLNEDSEDLINDGKNSSDNIHFSFNNEKFRDAREDIQIRFIRDKIINSTDSKNNNNVTENYDDINNHKKKCDKNLNEIYPSKIPGNQYSSTANASNTLDLFDLPYTSWLELASNYQSLTKKDKIEGQLDTMPLGEQGRYNIKMYELGSDTSRNTSNSSESEFQNKISNKLENTIFPLNTTVVGKSKPGNKKFDPNRNIKHNLENTSKHLAKGKTHFTNNEENKMEKTEKTTKLFRKKSTKTNNGSRSIHVWRINEKDRLEQAQQRNRISALKSRQKKILTELEFKNGVESVMTENNSLKEKLGHCKNIINRFINFIHNHMDGHDDNDREDLKLLISDIRSIDKEIDNEENDDVKKFVEETEAGVCP